MKNKIKLSDREHTVDSWGRCTCCGYSMGLVGWDGPDTVATCPSDAVEEMAARAEETADAESEESEERDHAEQAQACEQARAEEAHEASLLMGRR